MFIRVKQEALKRFTECFDDEGRLKPGHEVLREFIEEGSTKYICTKQERELLDLIKNSPAKASQEVAQAIGEYKYTKE